MVLTGFGAEQVSNDFTAFGNNFGAHVRAALEKWIINVVLIKARLKAPILSGNLRNSLAIVNVILGTDMISFIVGWGTRAEYGRFQERGTKFIQPRQFMLTSITESATQLSGFWVRQIEVSEVNNYLQKGLKTFRFRPSFT